jgi:branched-chain amino acid aminotransferase
MLEHRRIWVDGRLVPFAEATVHVLAQSLQRGTAVFDVLSVHDSSEGPVALGLREHVARFGHSMEAMGMAPAHHLAELERAVAATVLANPGAEIVKLTACLAEPTLDALPASPVPSISVAALSVDDFGATPHRDRGLRLRTATAAKLSSSALPPGVKLAASYTVGVRERLEAQRDGWDDVVFRTAGGDLAEGTTTSLFVVHGHTVIAPPLDIVLDGIMRRIATDVARSAGLHVQVRPVSWEEVESADELFVTSTTRLAVPVADLDGRAYPDPGPVTKSVRGDLDRLVAGQHPSSRRWLTALVPLAG